MEKVKIFTAAITYDDDLLELEKKVNEWILEKKKQNGYNRTTF